MRLIEVCISVVEHRLLGSANTWPAFDEERALCPLQLLRNWAQPNEIRPVTNAYSLSR